LKFETNYTEVVSNKEMTYRSGVLALERKRDLLSPAPAARQHCIALDAVGHCNVTQLERVHSAEPRSTVEISMVREAFN
jgi:hypothetical protein